MELQYCSSNYANRFYALFRDLHNCIRPSEHFNYEIIEERALLKLHNNVAKFKYSF